MGLSDTISNAIAEQGNQVKTEEKADGTYVRQVDQAQDFLMNQVDSLSPGA